MDGQVLVGAIVVGFFVAIILAMIRKGPFVIVRRGLAKLSRLIGIFLRPLRLRTLMRARWVARLLGHTRNTRQLRDAMPSAWASVGRFYSGESEFDSALGKDFSHERSHVNKERTFFKKVDWKAGYIRLPDTANFDQAKVYADQITRFLNARIEIPRDIHLFYEEIDGAFTIRSFKESDGAFFYLLEKYRKAMTGNVKKLTLLFALIFSLVVTANIVIYYLTVNGAVVDWPVYPSDILPERLYRGVGAIATVIFGYAAMLGWYKSGYILKQSLNGSNLDRFATAYFSRMNTYFTDTVARAQSVTVGEEKDSKILSEKAKLYTLNVQWLAYRFFFLETFTRNEFFQIRRNCSYYLTLLTLAVVLSGAIVLWVVLNTLLDSSTLIQLMSLSSPENLVLYFGLLLLFLSYMLFLMDSKLVLEDALLTTYENRFDTLNLAEKMSTIVGKYAEDVGYWKNRFGGVGG